MAVTVKNRIVNPSFEPVRLTAEDRLHHWAYRDVLRYRQQVLLISAARTACLAQTHHAGTEGLPFTPIYWYYVDRETTPVMTLWEMNDE